MSQEHSTSDTPRWDSARWAQIAAYVAGDEMSAEQAVAQDAVRQWIMVDSRRVVAVEALTRAWAEAGMAAEAQRSPIDVAAGWRGVQARLRRGASPIEKAKQRRIGGRIGTQRVAATQRTFLGTWTLRQNATYWLSFMAAILVGVIGVHVLSHAERSHSQILLSRSYSTVAGQQATVTLADGSHALLGPATTLTVTTQSSDAGIDVQVIGQALFTVAHSQDRPFRVHAGNAIASVLGTTFMVRQYKTDRIARVIVTEGRVSLSGVRGTAPRMSSRVLLASMLGTVDDSGNVQVTPNIATEDYMSWSTGQIVFENTPAREAVIELGRVYGVDIRITDSTLAKQQLTWTVPVAQQSLSVVLVSLVAVLDAHTVQTGGIITLVPGRSASRRPVSPYTPSVSERQYGK